MNILIVEDQVLVLDALSSLLSLDENIHVSGKACNANKALAFLEKNNVDAVLTDIEMPELSGLDLAQKIKTQYPDIDIIIMTTFSKPGYIKRAMQIGVKAFILKEASSEYLLSIIKNNTKKMIIDPQLMLIALDDNDPLTDKERRALKFASNGLSTQKIAKKLHLSEGTVRNYLSEAISKLQAHNSIDAARIAKQRGWI